MKMYRTIYSDFTRDNITFTLLHIIKSTTNARDFLHCFHLTMYNRINNKFPCITFLLYVCARTYFPNCKKWIPIYTQVPPMLVHINVYAWRPGEVLSSIPLVYGINLDFWPHISHTWLLDHSKQWIKIQGDTGGGLYSHPKWFYTYRLQAN